MTCAFGSPTVGRAVEVIEQMKKKVVGARICRTCKFAKFEMTGHVKPHIKPHSTGRCTWQPVVLSVPPVPVAIEHTRERFIEALNSVGLYGIWSDWRRECPTWEPQA